MKHTKNIVIIGSGAIGEAFKNHLSNLYDNAVISCFSSKKKEKKVNNINNYIINYDDESSIEEASIISSKNVPIDMVIVSTGILHEGDLMPEKSLKELSKDKFHKIFQANTIFPALVAKHFLSKLNREDKSIFASLSARVGSISDNKLGGWYSYRASKSALNMIIKNASIEIYRKNKNAVVIGLHPGTVDSNLSKPFQSNVAKEKLFTPEFSVEKMTEVLMKITPNDSGKIFDFNGLEINS